MNHTQPQPRPDPAQRERVLVAMSGGVDSSVAAALLVEQGHEVVGAYMKNWINEENVIGNCPWEDDIDDARAVAQALGIEFRVVNLMREYRQRVVNYLLEGYQEGVTPNPDVMCNREIKFGVFLDYALDQGFEAVATGHYARLRHDARDAAGEPLTRIFEGADKNKDQTYFLALLRRHQLRRARFPIGDLPKTEVRRVAEKFHLPNAGKKDSQGICFIGEVKMSDFLERFVPDSPGDIVNLEGRVLGRHKGLHFYTIGQRRGIGVPSNRFKEFYVVLEKRRETNQLVVGFDREETPGLYAGEATISGVTWCAEPVTGERKMLVKPRYRSPSTPARVRPGNDTDRPGLVHVTFDVPQRALAVGQICAFYDGEELLGGGIFQRVRPVVEPAGS
jgi:tRNA-specific 2-thiouridylase